MIETNLQTSPVILVLLLVAIAFIYCGAALFSLIRALPSDLRRGICLRSGGHYWVGTTIPGDEDRGMFARFSRMQCSRCGYCDPALSDSADRSR